MMQSYCYLAPKKTYFLTSWFDILYTHAWFLGNYIYNFFYCNIYEWEVFLGGVPGKSMHLNLENIKRDKWYIDDEDK